MSSIAKFLNYNDDKNEAISNGFDTVKRLTGIGGIVYAGSVFASQRGFDVSNPGQRVKDLSAFTRGERSKVEQLGVHLQNEVFSASERIDQIRAKNLEENIKKITADNEIEEILKGNVRERNALLQAIIDNLQGATPDELEAARNQLYSLMEAGEQEVAKNMDSIKSQIQAATINQESSEALTRSYLNHRSVGHLLSGARATFGEETKRIGVKKTYASYDQYVAGHGLQNRQTITNNITRIRRLGGDITGFVSIDEFATGTGIRRGTDTSLYATVKFGNRSVPVPLHLMQEGGLSFVRTTTDYTTRYQTGTMLNANQLLSAMDSGANPDVFRNMQRAGGLVENHISFLERVYSSEGTLRNVTSTQANYLGERMRTMGQPIASSFALHSAGGRVGFDPRLLNNLGYSYLTQSNKAIVLGINDIPEDQRRTLVPSLASRRSDVFDAPNASATMRRTMRTPFANVTESFTQINLRGDKYLAPIDVFESYGFQSRIALPATARETQFLGRPEIFSDLVNVDESTTGYYRARANKAIVDTRSGHLGKSNRPVFATGEQIFSVRGDIPQNKNLAGMNMSGFLFTSPEAGLRAGLAEGMVYSGSTPMLRRLIPKSINLDEAQGKFVSFLQKEMAKSTTGSVKIDAIELFREFGEGNSIFLGSRDGQRVELPNLKTAQSYVIQATEVRDASQKRMLNIDFQLDELAEGNKIFSLLGKSKLSKTNIKDRGALIDLIMQSGIATSRGEAEDLADFYTNQFGANIKSSIFGTLDTTSKSPMYLAQLFAGGAEHFGVTLDTSTMNIRGNVAVEQQAQYIEQFIRRSVDRLKGEGVSNRGIGVLLGGFQAVAQEGKFGMNPQFVDKIIRSIDGGSADEILDYSRKGVVFGGAGVFAGTSESVLRDNLASFEPRVANYLSENLRVIHGLQENEVVDYVTNLLARKQNLAEESKVANAFGLMAETMSPLSNKALTDKKIERLIQEGQAVRLDKGASDQLAQAFASGDEAAVRRGLANVGDAGTRTAVLNIDDFIGSLLPGKEGREVADFLKQHFKSTEIALPAGATMERLGEFKIRTKDAGGSISIESEFTRSLVDFFNQVKSGAINKEVFQGSTFKSVTESLLGPAGVMVRNIFSGKISGSGSFNPRGLIIGKTKLFTNKTINEDMHKIAKLAFEGSKGKAVFGDATVFMNLMQDFKETARLTPGLKDVNKKGIKKLEREMIKDFLFTPFRLLESGIDPKAAEKLMQDYSVSVLGKRDPVLGPSHLMPNLNLINLDVGNKFNLLTADKGTSLSYVKNLGNLYNTAQKAMSSAGQAVTVQDQQLIAKIFGINMGDAEPLNLKDKNLRFEVFKRLKSQKISTEDLYKLSKVKGMEKAVDQFLPGFMKSVVGVGVGAGELLVPQLNATVNVESKGKGIQGLSTRMDYFKFAIGDFDGDIMSLFLDMKKQTRQAGQINMINQYKYGAKFTVLNELIGEGMKALGKRLGSGKLDIEKHMFHEAAKEEILKNVGGLDTQVKTGILGAAMNFSSMSPEAKGNVYAFMATAQEVLNIKAKKLPIASTIADFFATSLSEAYRTGDTGDVETMLRSLFKESALREGVEIKGVNFSDVHGTSPLFDEISKASSGQGVSVEDIITGMKEMVRSVRKYNLEALKSDNTASRLMSSRQVDNATLFRSLLQDGDLLETAYLRGGAEEVDQVFRTIQKSLDVSPGRITQGKAGAAVAALIGGSYLVSSFSTPGSFTPENAFSDYRVKDRMQSQNTLQAIQRGDSNIAPSSIMPQPHKEILGRQINTGQYYSPDQSAVNVMGKVPSLEQAYGVSSIVSRSGGRGLVTINDTRMPITGNYIDRMMGE